MGAAQQCIKANQRKGLNQTFEQTQNSSAPMLMGDSDEEFQKKQKEIFAHHGLKDEVEIIVGKDKIKKWEYDPMRTMSLRLGKEVLTLNKELIVRSRSDSP